MGEDVSTVIGDNYGVSVWKDYFVEYDRYTTRINMT